MDKEQQQPVPVSLADWQARAQGIVLPDPPQRPQPEPQPQSQPQPRQNTPNPPQLHRVLPFPAMSPTSHTNVSPSTVPVQIPPEYEDFARLQLQLYAVRKQKCNTSDALFTSMILFFGTLRQLSRKRAVESGQSGSYIGDIDLKGVSKEQVREVVVWYDKIMALRNCATVDEITQHIKSVNLFPLNKFECITDEDRRRRKPSVLVLALKKALLRIAMLLVAEKWRL